MNKLAQLSNTHRYAVIIGRKINGYHPRKNWSGECTILLDRMLLPMSLIRVKNSI
ncbi:hypothetical protein [Yersinia kristensenii]|uniref:hypothetical protein n=1 Tax=Yersinia kristensenii TaxID=28152 RepID=UPI000AA8E063|nr:hypothetical protein [Yersinia kristensenii]MDA5473148.1 hypothetical protein [Yersinia kristensenii]MDA5522112.1 hypothetical protein [Yersinia kristensenii]